MEPQDQPSRLHPGPGLTPTAAQGHRSGHAEHFSSSTGTGAVSDHNSQESEPLSPLHKPAPATPTSYNTAAPPGLIAGRPLPSSSLPNSPPSSPLPPRLAGTPPTNPPPRFFTRPYRRPVDHHHTHHGSVHGPGHGNGQNSSSIGVRSAFKDFVVPAQIILVCSILNVLWPTLLRIVTTTLEFLVLVLSSYYACARRSDDCYFLEPLLNDGQEAIYVGTIQWTLRTVFLVLFLSGLIFTGKKIERIWSTLVSNRQRPRSFWSPDNVWGWLMTYPNAVWVYLERVLPWKVARSTQTRSGSGQRHHRKASSTSSPASRHLEQLHSTSPKDRATSALSSGFGHIYSRKMAPSSSAVDTDAYSAGSGSEARPKSKSKKKSKNTEESQQQQQQRQQQQQQQHQQQQQPQQQHQQLQRDTANIDVPTIISNRGTPSGNCPESTTTRPTEAAVTSTKTSSNEERAIDAATAASNAVYETADDDDFISTQDRRRRKRAQRVSSASALIESLPKPSTASRETEPKSTQISESTSSFSLTSNTSKETTLPALPPTGNHPAEQRQPTVQQSGQPLTSAKATKESKATVATSLTQPVKKKDVSFNTQETTFQHPIHALNSTSQIVRLKPTHKRSQSAQLPSLSAWSAQSGTGHTKSGQSAALSRVILPTELTSEESMNSPATSSGSASNSTESRGYNLFGQSSIWYSPFQSGLDITIESDHEHGKHGSRSLARPRIQTGNTSTGKTNRPNLGYLPASSFFESSPRTPRIMPFSQHHSNQSPGFGLEDWSVRTRSSSIAAPLTPLLELDCVDPMDYFGGSRSASSSRRGSVENNLTESLLSGRARMFASSVLDISSSQGSEQPSLTRSHQHALSDGNFLSPQFSTSMMPTNSTTQLPLDTPTLGASSLISHHLPPASASSSTFLPVDDDADVAPVFVNPWESSYPYRSTHTMSETFLPFSTTTLPPLPESSVPSEEQDRQTSLLSLMNASANSSGRASARGSFDIGSSLASFEPNGSSSMGEDEKAAIRRGFMFPNIGAMALGPTDKPAFRPFASLEMSLAAAANQPPPLTEEPHYDSVELTMKDFPARRRGPKHDDSGRAESGEKRPKERHRRARSGHHKSASLGSFFPPMPPPSGLSENATPGIQGNSGETLDPLSRLPNHNGHGPSKLGRHHHHSTGGSSSKEGDLKGHGSGSSSSNRRRAAGASDHEGHYRGGGAGGGSSRHHHRQDSTTAKPKKKPVSPE